MTGTLVQRSGCAQIHPPHTQTGNASKGLCKTLAKLVQKTARMLVIGAILLGAAWCETAQGQNVNLPVGNWTNNANQMNIDGNIFLGLGNVTNNGTIENNSGNTSGINVMLGSLNNNATGIIRDKGSVAVGSNLNNAGTFEGNGVNNPIGALPGGSLLSNYLSGLPDVGIRSGNLTNSGIFNNNGNVSVIGVVDNSQDFTNNGSVFITGYSTAELLGLALGGGDFEVKDALINKGTFSGNGLNNAVQVADLLDSPLLAGLGGLGDLGGDFDLAMLDTLGIEIKGGVGVVALGNIVNEGEFSGNGVVMAAGSIVNNGGEFISNGKGDNQLNVGIDLGALVGLPIDITPSIDVNVLAMGNLENEGGQFIDNGNAIFMGAANNVGGTIGLQTIFLSGGNIDNSDDGKIVHNGVVAALSTLDNTGGLMEHNGAVVSVGDMTNTGGTINENALVATLGTLDNSGDGKITRNLVVTANSIDNTNGGIIDRNATVTTLAGDLDNTGGNITNNGLVSVLGGNLDNTGGVITDNLAVVANSLDNRNGGIIVGNESVTVIAGNLNNSRGGTIADNEFVTVIAGNLNNSQGGTISNNDYVNVVAGDLYNRSGGRMVGNGEINVLAGNMVNNGRIDLEQGDLNVFGLRAVNNGTISGTGTIETLFGLDNNGTLSPGNNGGTDIGTLTIERQLRNNGGTFAIEIDPSHYTGNPIAGLDNDLVQVVDDPHFLNNGKAIINGGTVEVTAPSNIGAGAARYVGGTRYTFLTTESGLTVNNPLIADQPDDVLLFDFVTGHDDLKYWLTVKRNYFYGPYGKTFNQRAVGRYIDDIGRNPVPGSDFFDVLVELDALNGGIAHRKGISNTSLFALDQMSGAIYGTIAKSSITNTSLANNTLNDVLRRNAFGCECGSEAVSRSACDPCSKVSAAKGPFCYNLWGLAYGTGGNTLHDGNAYGYEQSFFGTLIGMDRRYGCSTRAGVYASYGEGRISGDLLERSDSKELLTGLYLRKQMAVGYMLLSGGLGYNQYDTERTISFVNRKANNRHNALVGTVYGERGLEIHRKYVTWQPFAGLQYIGNQQESFTEHGADSLNLVGDITTGNSFRSLLGTRVSTNFAQVKRGKLSLSGQAYWMHEFLDAYNNFTAQFSNPNHANFSSNAKFTVRGNDTGRDWAVLGTGLNYDRGKWRLFTGYDLTMNSRQVLHTGNAGLACGW